MDHTRSSMIMYRQGTKSSVINVANVLETLVAEAFKGGDATAHGEVFVKRETVVGCRRWSRR